MPLSDLRSISIHRASCHGSSVLTDSLLQNHQFHTLILDLVAWLSKTERSIKEMEPLDLTADAETLESHYYRFKEIRTDLERSEPRVVSLYEACRAVFVDREIPERFRTTYTQLSELKMKLRTLIKSTGIYILKLGSVLGKDMIEISSPLSSPSTTFGTSLQTMSYDVSLLQRCTIL